MRSKKIHLFIGTLICAATLLVFLALSGSLPDNVPVQIGRDGNITNTLPKSLFVFGFPAIFVVANLFKSIPLVKKIEENVSMFYIVPAFAVAITVLSLCFALNITG